jgi:Ferritin-like
VFLSDWAPDSSSHREDAAARFAPRPVTPRDSAIFLMQIAAEIEHALLVQYLYAAFSLNRPRARRAADRLQRHLQDGEGRDGPNS